VAKEPKIQKRGATFNLWGYEEEINARRRQRTKKAAGGQKTYQQITFHGA